MNALPSPHTTPKLSLTLAFTTWKSLLLAIALASGIASDYDTSTSLFFARVYPSNASIPALASRLTRWDALYFMHAARRGLVFEQESAFGVALPAVASRVSRGLERGLGMELGGVAWEPVVGVVLAHISHLIGVLALHQLTVLIFANRKLAYLAAALHIISPAGIFLSAPYNESPFSGLTFLGNLLFATALSRHPGRSSIMKAGAMVAAGASFGLATLFRSNGLLSGLIFAAQLLKQLPSSLQAPSFSRVISMISIIIGGLLIAVGFVTPQYFAWVRYCGSGLEESLRRPWCEKTIPSIYTFVQEHYWNVGFLRYWTPNQIPLFLLATPMLAILITSGLQLLKDPSAALNIRLITSNPDQIMLARTLAATQTLLAVLAITNYHVQIITRLASGSPVWYWWVAGCLMDGKRRSLGAGIVVFMVMYAGIQGGLFASFLPPA